jgi:ATP-dependent RNA helicase SUPV3L1/SUV3
VADLPPESAVHLAGWNFASAADCRNAGYRRIGDEYLRIDLVERVIKKAHEARGELNLFGMDLSFVTSLGVSEKGLGALMRDAGFRKAEAPASPAAESDESSNLLETSAAAIGESTEPSEAVEAKVEDAAPADGETEVVLSDPPVVSALTWWRWVGLNKVANNRQKPNRQSANKGKPMPNDRQKAPPPKQMAPSAPSELALQLAALTGRDPTKAK